MKDARERSRSPLSKRESKAIICMKDYYREPEKYIVPCNFTKEQRDAILNVLNGIFLTLDGEKVVIDTNTVNSFLWLSERPQTAFLK